jgi:hypothetical protein
MAVWTRLELAASALTGQRSNQLSYQTTHRLGIDTARANDWHYTAQVKSLQVQA